jgi:cytochrome c peroxidase
MKKTIISIALAVTALITFQACKKEAATAGARVPSLPEENYRYDLMPSGGNTQFNPLGANTTINNDAATLGRVLFYETQLSINNRISCGTCHQQSKAFADGKKFSAGFEEAITKRNAPAILNPGTQNSYFWDMRESNLDLMVTRPIANHIEMGLESQEYMTTKIANLPYYTDLFTKAFGTSEVTAERIGQALGTFVKAMVTAQSKYDEGVGSGFANFTDQELTGKQLFTTTLPCAGCHGGENFTGWGTHVENIGLDRDYTDNGMPGTDWNTGRELDGWFKVPSLRNVSLTGPYMHDGRFNTLEEVVEFYNSGIQSHDQLAFALREGWNGGGGVFGGEGGTGDVQPLRMNLTTYEKGALVAFLKTLSDESILFDPKYSDPFVTK